MPLCRCISPAPTHLQGSVWSVVVVVVLYVFLLGKVAACCDAATDQGGGRRQVTKLVDLLDEAVVRSRQQLEERMGNEGGTSQVSASG
eukprot:2740946-Rhodomonas_salina.1